MFSNRARSGADGEARLFTQGVFMKKTIEKNTTVAAGKVSLGNKIAFACGDIFGGGSFNVINFLFVEFLTLVVGLPMTSLAVVLLLTKIWDGVIDPFIGKITDGKTPGRFGKRRFFMLVAAPFLLVGFGAKQLFFCKKKLGGTYARGILKGIRTCDREKKVRFMWKHFPAYAGLQLELWKNIGKRFVGEK